MKKKSHSFGNIYKKGRRIETQADIISNISRAFVYFVLLYLFIYNLSVYYSSLDSGDFKYFVSRLI